MKVAVIDLGTNTFNLLVAEKGEVLSVIHSEEVGVFLGASAQDGGGIEAGTVTAEAVERGIAALKRLSTKARELGAVRISAFGTSALRNARNGQAFVQLAQEVTGVTVTIIPGDEEASLILAGVQQAVPLGNRPVLIMDIGGGSIEFILATNKALMWKRSFELGVTRLLERFKPSDPVTLEEHFRIAEHLDAQLEPLWAVIDRHAPHALIGSAGSFDTLAAIVQAERGEALPQDATTLVFSADEFDALNDRLMRMPRAQRLLIPGLPDYRVDTLPIALIAIERVLIAGGFRDLRWSRYALKEGAAAKLA